jgi:hypothetical protein
MVINQSDGEPWRYRFIMAPAMIVCVIVTGAAIYFYTQGSCSIVACMDQLPLLKYIGVTLAVLGVKAKAIERMILDRRKSSHSARG